LIPAQAWTLAWSRHSVLKRAAAIGIQAQPVGIPPVGISGRLPFILVFSVIAFLWSKTENKKSCWRFCFKYSCRTVAGSSYV